MILICSSLKLSKTTPESTWCYKIHHHSTGTLQLKFFSSSVDLFNFDGSTISQVVCRENAKTSSWWGGRLAVLTDSCSSKELCEFRHSENITLLNASEIEDVAYKTWTYALARPYGALGNRSLHMVNRSMSSLLFVSTPCESVALLWSSLQHTVFC